MEILIYIRPIHKKGSRHNIQNYRPIVTGCALAKVFDSIMADKLPVFIGLPIRKFQYAFLPARSTESNLLLFTDYIRVQATEYQISL